MLVEDAPGGRAAADLQDARQTINVVRWIGADLLPALVAADDPVVQPHRPIPRQAEVPFHVAVEAEQFAQIIQAEVRRIPPSRADALPLHTVRRNAKNRCFALEKVGRSFLRDVFAVFDARAVAGHEIKPAVETAQDRVRVVVAAGVEFVSDSTPVNQTGGAGRAIPFKHLDPIAADRVQPVAVNQQSLRPAPAESGRDDLEGIEDAVAVLIDKPAHRVAVADQQPPLAIERQGVTTARELRSGRAIDVKTSGQLKSAVQLFGGAADARHVRKDERAEKDRSHAQLHELAQLYQVGAKMQLRFPGSNSGAFYEEHAPWRGGLFKRGGEARLTGPELGRIAGFPPRPGSRCRPQGHRRNRESGRD